MARIEKKEIQPAEQNPHISYDVMLARQILNDYAEDGELTAQKCVELGLSETVAERIEKSLNDDGVLDEQERVDLYEKEGVSKKFIWMLAGTRDGSRPVKMRVRNLIADLEGGNYRALWELKDIGPYAEEAVPAVVDTLRHGLSLYLKQKKWDKAPGIVYVPPISIGYGIGKNVVDGQGNGKAIVQMATEALGAIGAGSSESVPLILHALHRVSERILRVEFVKALGLIGAEDTVSKLVDILCNEKEHIDVRTAAAKALGQIASKEDPRVVPALQLYAVYYGKEAKRCHFGCNRRREFMETADNALRAIDKAERQEEYKAYLNKMGVTEQGASHE